MCSPACASEIISILLSDSSSSQSLQAAFLHYTLREINSSQQLESSHTLCQHMCKEVETAAGNVMRWAVLPFVGGVSSLTFGCGRGEEKL